MVTKRILVVDDNEQILQLVQRQLAKSGFDVATAPSAKDAVAWCEQFGLPDLLVSDVQMPAMSGPELYLALKREFGDVPVLFISTDAAGASEAGARRILGKPFSGRQLIEAIDTFFTPQA